MKGSNIGEFEELVMLITAVLYPHAYGVAIRDEIADRSRRQVTLSAVHAALHRLEKKGFLQSSFGETTPKRGGKRKRYFSVTVQGSKVLEASRALREQIWEDIDGLALLGGS